MTPVPRWKQFVDTAAIITGAATAVAVLIQFIDFNRREHQRKVEEWQTAVVYQAIETERQISFKQISDDYVKEAKRSNLDIPLEKLSDAEISLVLVRLIQSQAVIETGGRIYSPRTYSDPLSSVAAAMNLANSVNRNLAKNVAIGWQVISLYREPKSVDEMKHDMIKEGADQKFLEDNMPVVLQQMQMQGYLEFLPGGRVMPAAGALHLQVQLPADLLSLKGQLDGPLLRLIMTTDPLNASNICFATLQDYNGATEYRKAIELGLLDPSDMPSNKNCAKNIRFIPTEKLGKAQGFLFSSALAVLGN